MLFRSPTLLLYQKFRQDFFGGSPTEDQDQVTWDAVKSLVSMYFNRELSNPQVLQLALAAKGITGNLGWSGFIGSIPKERREPITYLMGLRYLGMKKTAEGKTLLKSIVESEGASEVIKKLAEAGLEAIGP